jgi:4-hydroxythreonine-4-phosphate dehydrogenase
MTPAPLLALTLGDIAGVGPEIVAKALGDPEVRERAQLAVFGPLRPLRSQMRQFAPGIELSSVATAAELRGWDFARATPVVDDETIKAPPCRDVVGQVDADAGRVSHASVLAAVDGCLSGAVDAMVTAPIHKTAWAAAGVTHPGHTELLAERTGAPDAVMMMASPELKVTLATVHIPLARVPESVTPERLRTVIDVTAESMPLLGVAGPRIAVAGLNPHAGEGGLFGDEEIRVIGPAVEAARAAGHDVSGPHPADTVFSRAREGAFDVVVALYHDQGLCAVKTLDFERTVNITLGLPIIRTSVDHGTAFDIAGKGLASPQSLFEAIGWAARMASNRRQLAARGAGS